MPLYYIEKVLKGLSPNHTNIKIVGGEPTLHNDFLEVLGIMEKYKFKYIVITDSVDILKYTSFFKKSRYLQNIRISIDGDKEIHNYIREKNDFENMTKVLIDLKSNDLPVQVNYTINKLNYKNISKTYDFFHTLGIKMDYGFIKFTSKFEDGTDLCFMEDEMETFIQKLEHVKNNSISLFSDICNGIIDDLKFIEKEKAHPNPKHIGCYAGQSSLVIDNLGNVWPCALFKGHN